MENKLSFIEFLGKRKYVFIVVLIVALVSGVMSDGELREVSKEIGRVFANYRCAVTIGLHTTSV